MSETLINLIIQLSHRSGRQLRRNAQGQYKSFDLGPIANAIIGALGGASGGWLLSSLVTALAGAAGNGELRYRRLRRTTRRRRRLGRDRRPPMSASSATRSFRSRGREG